MYLTCTGFLGRYASCGLFRHCSGDGVVRDGWHAHGGPRGAVQVMARPCSCGCDCTAYGLINRGPTCLPGLAYERQPTLHCCTENAGRSLTAAVTGPVLCDTRTHPPGRVPALVTALADHNDLVWGPAALRCAPAKPAL